MTAGCIEATSATDASAAASVRTPRDRSGGVGHAAPQPAAGFGHSNVDKAGAGQPGEIPRIETASACRAGRSARHSPASSSTSPVSASHVVPSAPTLRVSADAGGHPVNPHPVKPALGAAAAQPLCAVSHGAAWISYSTQKTTYASPITARPTSDAITATEVIRFACLSSQSSPSDTSGCRATARRRSPTIPLKQTPEEGCYAEEHKHGHHQQTRSPTGRVARPIIPRVRTEQGRRQRPCGVPPQLLQSAEFQSRRLPLATTEVGRPSLKVPLHG